MSNKNISRRSFLSAALAAPVVAAVASSCAQVRTPQAGTRLSGQALEAVDHLIIGTGYGGAVAAYRLASVGQRVTMLEMGKRWDTPGSDGKIFTPIMKPDSRSMWYRNRTELPMNTFLGLSVEQWTRRGPGALDRRQLGDMDVYLGRGVGGGSLVNAGMAPRPRRDMVAKQLPAVDVEEFFATYLPRAERELGISSIDPAFLESTPWYQYARTGRRDAQQAGYKVVDIPNNYDFAYMQAEAAGRVPRSALNGELIFGNNHGKRNLTKTYLGRAEATGRVEIHTMTEVLTVRPATGGYRVETQVRNFDGTIVARPTYLARRVYFGAGSVGTTEILLRSAAQGYLTDLSPELGRGWGANGNVTFGRANHLWRPTGNKQSMVPVLGIDNWDSPNACFAEIAPLPVPLELYLQFYLVIADNPNSGTLSLQNGRLTSNWVRSMNRPAIEKVRATFDVINRQQGTLYRNDLFGNGEVFNADFTYHPLGGAVLGQVTDAYGRLPGYQGLYVTDGSLIPRLLGVNPYLTITALAERLMDEILTKDLA